MFILGFLKFNWSMLLRASYFTHLAGSRFPKFSVFRYGGDKAKSVYSFKRV